MASITGSALTQNGTNFMALHPWEIAACARYANSSGILDSVHLSMLAWAFIFFPCRPSSRSKSGSELLCDLMSKNLRACANNRFARPSKNKFQDVDELCIQSHLMIRSIFYRLMKF